MTKKYIAYVDDDIDDIGFMLESFPAEAKVGIQTFQSGEEFLAYLDLAAPEEAPALIVLDLNLPSMNGWQILEELKERPVHSNIPVILFSTTARPINPHRHDHHVADYVQKPNNVAGLRAFCQKLIDYCNVL